MKMFPGTKGLIRSGWLPWALTLLIFALCGCDPSTNSEDTADPELEHVLGDVWAASYPTNIALQVADHTLIQALDTDGNAYSFKCFGYRTDGDILADTLTANHADITVVGHMASEPPCKWPLEYYLRIGVCHQCANRALYYTGKTVSGARGYDFFAAIYGTYGDESQASYQKYSMQNCLDAAPEWQGDPYLSDSMEIKRSGPTPDSINKEIRLYQRYRSYQSDEKQMQNSSVDFESYLETRFRFRIKERLGDEFPEKSISGLLAIQKTFRKLKKELDHDMVAHEMATEVVMDRYTNFFNELAGAFKAYLTPLEYEQLFDIGFHELIDFAVLNHELPELSLVEK